METRPAAMPDFAGELAVACACILGLVGIAVGDVRASHEREMRAAPSPAAAAAPSVVATPAPAATPPPPAPWTPAPEVAWASPAMTAKSGSSRTPTFSHESVASSSHRLPVEIVRRIVRQNYGRFRLCYETGLRADSSLRGRIEVKLAIGRDGAVTMASDGGSTMPNQSVVACVVRSFGMMSFPQPEGGVELVKYSFDLAPSS